jgi:hypothetical protein
LENARFCHGCGAPVQDGDIHAEYKQVTVPAAAGHPAAEYRWEIDDVYLIAVDSDVSS